MEAVTQLGDVETFVYPGMSEEGQERWLASMLAMAEKGEYARVPFDTEDTVERRENKQISIDTELGHRKKEIEQSLRLLDARLMLCGRILKKGERTEIDFRKFEKRILPAVKKKFLTAVASGKLELVRGSAKVAASVNEPVADEQQSEVETQAKRRRRQQRAQAGIEG